MNAENDLSSCPSHMMNMEDIIAPMTISDLLKNFWGKRYFIQSGESARYRHLFPWSALNDALTHHRLEYPRMRLAKDGKILERSEYMREAASGWRLKQDELIRHLKSGATLIVNDVDQMFQPLKQLTENLERSLGDHVQVNAYAGWGTSFGFDLHWDDHDVIILQLYGQKDWKVYGASRLHPVKADRSLKFPPPEKPVWEGALQPGDLLYMPRGWWHVATPKAEATLHLTISFARPTALDLVDWLRNKLEAQDGFRKDLPRFGSAEEKRALADSLRTALAGAVTSEIVDEYLSFIDGRVPARSNFSLPDQVLPPVDLEPSGEFCINIPRNIRLKADKDNNVVKFHAIGRDFNLPLETYPILHEILSGRPICLERASELAGNALTSDEIKHLIRNLLNAGVLRVSSQRSNSFIATSVVEA